MATPRRTHGLVARADRASSPTSRRRSRRPSSPLKAIVLGVAVRPALRRLDGLPRAARRPDRQRLDPDRRARHLGAQAARRLDHPREQHRPDDRIGRRIGRRRRRLHDPGADLPDARRPGLLQLLPDHDARVRRRHPRRADDGAAAPRADRQGTRRAALPGRHGVRGRAGRRRARRRAGDDWCSAASASARCGSRCRGSSTSSAPSIGYSMPRDQPVSRTPRSTSTSRPSTWASATSSARASPASMFAGGVLSWLVLLPLLSHPRRLHDGAVPAGARPSGLHGIDPDDRRRPAVERLHPLHRRRRGARRRA